MAIELIEQRSSSSSSSSSSLSSSSSSSSSSTAVYTREANAALPSSDTDLATAFTAEDLTKVAIVDAIYVPLNGAQNDYALFMFKDSISGANVLTATWTGKSSIAPSASTAYLQIYNYDSTAWETLDSDNLTAANTDFTLTGSITSNLANYLTGGKACCRMYQRLT
jgi:hypothetical protein